MSSPARDSLRGKILSEKGKQEMVTLDDGTQVLVKSTTIGQMLDTIEIPDAKARIAKMLIMACYVPETGEPLFEDADLDVLMELPSNGAYRKLMDAVSGQTIQAQTEAAKKPSSEASPASS